MKFLKAAFYTAMGTLFAWSWLTGHTILMNWGFVIWLPVLAFDAAQALSPWDKSFFGPSEEDKTDD